MQSFRQLIGNALHVAGCCALLASLCARSCAGDVVQARLQGPAPDAAEDPAALRLPEGPVATLDGTWLLSTDPSDTGREQRWFEAPRAGSKPSNVPWIIQEAFPGYHGVAWYWRDFVPSTNTYASGRSLLRFWAVDFSAEVWLNGIRVGAHEGGETPFSLDVTDVLKVNGTNRLAVRVVNPTHRPIDGLTLNQTPRQARVIPYSAGAAYDCGGITESVELLSVP